MFKTSRRKTDIVFSQYLRSKIGYCEKCRKIKPREVSHFWGRRNETVRFDEENCDVLCNYCHRTFHENPSSYHEWKLNKLGKKRFNALMVRANQTGKRDDKLTLLTLQQLIK